MRNLTNWYLSIKNIILIHIGGFSLGLTVVYILFLVNIDALGVVESCKYAITDNKRWLCKAINSKSFTLILGLVISVFWIIFIPVFKRHNIKYKKSD